MNIKKRLLFISFFKIDNIINDGVAKKINSQINALKELGFFVDYIFIKGYKIYINTNNKEIFLFDIEKAYKDTFKLYSILEKMLKERKLGNLDYIYIRKTSSNIASTKFLRTSNKLRIKNIVEIPVYPYKGEKIKSLKSFIGYYQDLFLNKLFAKKYIDLIVNYNGYNKIFGQISIPINNGIDMKNIKLSKKAYNNNVIHIGTASSMAYWHGYDRIIQGLYLYYSKNIGREVKLHLIGEGPETKKYKEMCKLYNLEDRVIFHNKMGGKALDSIFNQLDIGIIALGIFRKGLNNVSSIKTAEFCARGIPFIYAGKEAGLDGNEEFALKVANDDTPIDIETVIQFYENIRKNSDIREKMRDIAEERFTWVKQYKEIFKMLEV